MQPFRLPPFEIADDRSAYQRQVIEVEGESGVAQWMVEVFLRRPLPLSLRNLPKTTHNFFRRVTKKRGSLRRPSELHD